MEDCPGRGVQVVAARVAIPRGPISDLVEPADALALRALRVLAILGATLPPKPTQARGIVRKPRMNSISEYDVSDDAARFGLFRLTGGIVGYAETSRSIKRSSLAISWSDWHAGQFLRVRA